MENNKHMQEKSFVSRAGYKLDFALDHFKIDIHDKICVDFGCGSGGFTDCLLQKGAKIVYAVDTGYGALEWKIRKDPRVSTHERTNALFFETPEKSDFISIDTGWTKQQLIIPHALTILKDDGNIISLVKPHYEAEKKQLFKGTVKKECLPDIIQKIKNELSELPIIIQDIIECPIKGKRGGNVEYLMWVKKTIDS